MLADNDIEGAEKLRARLSDDKVTTARIDASDSEAVRQMVKDCDVVVNSLPWDFSDMVLETAADLGVDYVDFCMTVKAMKDFDSVAKMCRDAGITALTANGLEPGISNALAKHASGMLDTAEEVHVIDGDSGAIDDLWFWSTWSPVDWIDEVSVPAAVYRDGKIEYVPPLHEREVYDFPEPVGTLPVYKTLHDETFIIPKHIEGLKHCDFRIAIDDRFASAARVIRRLGLHRKEPVDIRGAKVRPIDVVAAMMPRPVEIAGKPKGHGGTVVEVIGVKDGKRTKVRMWTFASHEEVYERYGTNTTGFLVGVGGAVPTEILVEGLVKEKGLLVPEQLPPGEFVTRLRRKGLEIHEEKTTLDG